MCDLTVQDIRELLTPQVLVHVAVIAGTVWGSMRVYAYRMRQSEDAIRTHQGHLEIFDRRLDRCEVDATDVKRRIAAVEDLIQRFERVESRHHDELLAMMTHASKRVDDLYRIFNERRGAVNATDSTL